MGDESKLAQSFQRIRDLVRNRRLQEEKQNENNSRLEQIVREVMQRHAEEEAFKAGKFIFLFIILIIITWYFLLNPSELLLSIQSIVTYAYE